VKLVETGKFVDNKKLCKKVINEILKKKLNANKVDVATLSSTHLPFLLPIIQTEFPNITFLDPGFLIAKKISTIIKKNESKKNLLKIFTSSNPKIFEKKLQKIGIKNKVSFLSTN